MFPRHLRGRGVETESLDFEEKNSDSSRVSETKSHVSTPQSSPTLRLPSRKFNWAHPFPPQSLTRNGFVLSPGRVNRGFDPYPYQRALQAEEILKSFHRFPPQEGELFVIQIDQDSPPPPPPTADPKSPWQKIRQMIQTRKKAIEEIQSFLSKYTGRTVVFQARQTREGIRLQELNPAGSLASASHSGQLWGDFSCNDDICGMPYLRGGIYPFGARSTGAYSPIRDYLMRVARDLNGDGVIDQTELTRSQHAHGFAIQIHPGFVNGPQSVGCQTFPPNDFEQLQKIIKTSGVETFYYVLVRRPNEKGGAAPL